MNKNWSVYDERGQLVAATVEAGDTVASVLELYADIPHATRWFAIPVDLVNHTAAFDLVTRIKVWVAELETADGQSWVSVHESETLAKQRLLEKVSAWGLGHLESGLVRSYSICAYQVES